MFHLVNCMPNLVGTAKEADLCWPNCRNWNWGGAPDSSWAKQYIKFEVRHHDEPFFEGCTKYVSFNPELIGKALAGNDERETMCNVGVPYFHGIWAPGEARGVAPWDLMLERDTLLSFFGGVWRKKLRWEFHAGAMKVAGQLQANGTEEAQTLRAASDQPHYHKYYSVPLETEAVKKAFPEMTVNSQRRKAHQAAMEYMWSSDAMYELAWLTYATSQFCWNPAGDTPTRRAFYDAWMFGCIPVVPQSSEQHYARVYGGSFFSFHRTTLKDIVVIVPDNATAADVFRTLLGISQEDIAFRRRTMKLLAPFLQWNFHTSKSAIRMFFHAVFTKDAKKAAKPDPKRL